MSTSSLTTSQPDSGAEHGTHGDSQWVGDSFAVGMLVMLCVNILQRGIGLLRSLGFCHFLSEEQLGHWALANSFFFLAVPLAVLGLPGSFGKFVEYYRTRRQLGGYVRYVGMLSGCGLLALCVLMLLQSDLFLWLIFGTQHSMRVLGLSILALVAVTLFSYVYDLVAGLRQVRVASLMQFVQSCSFAVLGLGGLWLYGQWQVLLAAFAVANLLAMLPAAWVLFARHADDLGWSSAADNETFTGKELIRRILPYAAMLWLMNLLSNCFEVGDRYMLLHLSPGGESVGGGLVGQYHCGRILPNLLTSLALMLGGVLLPFISLDWEARRFSSIAARLRQTLQAAAICFMAFSIAATLIAPSLFELLFGGRYDDAMTILPISLLQASWVGLFLIGETYLMCAERGKQLSLILIVALVVNFSLNVVLIQNFGLIGAVSATATANLFALLLLLWRMNREGCQLGQGTLIVSLAPVTILGGPILATASLLAVVLAAGRTDWLLNEADRRQIDAALIPRLKRYRIPIDSIWP